MCITVLFLLVFFPDLKPEKRIQVLKICLADIMYTGMRVEYKKKSIKVNPLALHEMNQGSIPPTSITHISPNIGRRVS